MVPTSALSFSLGLRYKGVGLVHESAFDIESKYREAFAAGRFCRRNLLPRAPQLPAGPDDGSSSNVPPLDWNLRICVVA